MADSQVSKYGSNNLTNVSDLWGLEIGKVRLAIVPEPWVSMRKEDNV